MSFINAITALSTIFTIMIIGHSFHCFCVATGREHRNDSKDLNDFDIVNVRAMITVSTIVALYLLALCLVSYFTTISFGKYLMRFLLATIEMFLLIYIGSHGTMDDEMAILAMKIALPLIIICVSFLLIGSIQLTITDFVLSIIFLVASVFVHPEILLSIFILLTFDIPDSMQKKIKRHKKEMNDND